MWNEMKWFLIVVFLMISTTDALKPNDKKSTQKKASYLKPTKAPKSILEQFKELPADDLAFLKDVDDQFKNHGSNIKIKVVKDNSTNSKNQKRTINGEVGYGYQSNQHSQGYYFSKPKYEVYPYSQEDIPPLTHHQQQQLHQKYGPPNYRPHEVLSNYRNQYYLPQQLHTTVEIAPSHGFEIKETSNGYETYPQQHHQQYNQQISFQPENQPTGPVIVLRIPGPQKYATHLQMLLQQYLEIRAAEYIKLLQEQEQHQQSVPHNYHQYSYETNQHDQPVYQNHYQQEVEPLPHYQVQVQSARIVYQNHQESSDDSSRQNQYNHDTDHSQLQTDDHAYQYQTTYQPDVEQYYHVDEYQHSNNDDSRGEQHYVYPKIPSTTESSLQITENFPRDTHTHAYFTKATSKPSTYHVNSHHQSHLEEDHDTFHPPLNYQSDNVEYYYEKRPELDKDYGSASEQSVITITQRTPAPYNYHAHPPQAHRTPLSSDRMSLKGAKRQTSSTFTQDQYAKLNKLISRMKKKITPAPKETDQ